MKKTFTLLIATIIIVTSVHAQNTFPSSGATGIGTTSPNASSLLDIQSTTKGFLPPRMTLVQHNAIVTPAAGLLIYQTNSTPGLYYYSGTAWVAVSLKGANTSLSNLKGLTAVNVSLFPVAVDSIDIGSATLPMRRAWFSRDANINGITVGTGGGNNIFNTALGSSALSLNTTGSSNTATGFNTLRSNTTGYYNSAYGAGVLAANTTGYFNTAFGAASLVSNTTGYNNTANGYSALYSNTSGYSNIANGVRALKSNTIGSYNTAIGTDALLFNSTGFNNTGIGTDALLFNSTGFYNIGIGTGVLSSNLTGYLNTFVGANADVTQGDLSNASAFGSNSFVDASDKVSIGDFSVTSIGGQVGWTNFSDGRIKQNIKENVPGLAFINLLKPVTYNFNLAKQYELIGRKDSAEWKTKYDIEKINFTGFVAQDVDAAAKKIKYDFSGIDKTGKIMGLRYADFVVPLVKAVQELSKITDDKDAKIAVLEKQNADLEIRMEKLEAMMNIQQSAANNTQKATINNAASLAQNIPNPFNNTTTINYTLPQQYSNAKMIITDKTGKTVNEISISGSGKGSFQFNPASLANGTYQYSLYVDEKVIASKQMLFAK